MALERIRSFFNSVSVAKNVIGQVYAGFEKAGLKIVDVVIQGISMAVTDRNQFSSVIERGGGNIQALIDALNSQNLDVAEPPASAANHS